MSRGNPAEKFSGKRAESDGSLGVYRGGDAGQRQIAAESTVGRTRLLVVSWWW